MRLLSRLWQTFSKRRKIQLLALASLMLLGGLAELMSLGAVIPFITLLAQPERVNDFPVLQSLAESVGLDTNTLLLPVTLTFAGMALTAAGIRLLLTWAMHRYVHGLGHDLAAGIYSNILHQPYTWHTAHNSGDLIATVNKVHLVTSFFLIPLMEAFISGFLCLVILTTLLFINATAAIIAGVSFACIYILISFVLKRRIKANGETIARAQKTRIQTLQEGLGAIRDVIIGDFQPAYAERFNRDDYAMNRALGDNSFMSLTPRYLLEGIAVALIAIVALYVVNQPGGFTGALPVLGALALGGQKLMPMFQTVYHGWSRAHGHSAVLKDVLALTELTSVKALAPVPLKFESQIRLQNVSFAYSPTSREILRNLSVTIPKGARVGFVGETGSGKSTLLDLIMGLLEPSAGEILIDEQPLNTANRSAWQLHVAHVPQSIYLSDASIRENIAFGVPLNMINHQQVMQAAQQAQIADFIDSLPEGYDTITGERGVRLSGGQRQRIGIARALYKQADVLVLDEATSALDEATEQALVECIDKLSRKLTVLVIAHRLSTLKNCDRVISMNDGQLKTVQPPSGCTTPDQPSSIDS